MNDSAFLTIICGLWTVYGPPAGNYSNSNKTKRATVLYRPESRIWGARRRAALWLGRTMHITSAYTVPEASCLSVAQALTVSRRSSRITMTRSFPWLLTADTGNWAEHLTASCEPHYCGSLLVCSIWWNEHRCSSSFVLGIQVSVSRAISGVRFSCFPVISPEKWISVPKYGTDALFNFVPRSMIIWSLNAE